MNLICVEDGIDSSKEAGKLLISIIAAVAEMERENIRIQTMAGREQKAKEGKFKDAIQDKIGATVDTTDLEKQLSVLNASLHQAETIKTRLEQQMDNLDVTDTHYDKKISDLQRRLDAQYDRIDEVEETMAELKSQIY